MQYPGHFTRESFGYTDKGGWTQKGWDAWMEYRESLYAYWDVLAKRRFHALPEDKGTPVPGTGKSRWHSRKDSGKAGVIGSSRVLPHRYMDEGDKGKAHNRRIKRVERAQWLSEAMAELQEEYDAEEYDWTDYAVLTDPYDYPSFDSYMETEELWETANYNQLPYDDYCETCSGPCELSKILS